jgi:hypothetical protein
MRVLRVGLGVALLLVAPSVVAVSGAGAAVPSGPTNGLVLRYAFESAPNGIVDNLAGTTLDGRLVTAPASKPIVAGLAGYGKALQLKGASHEYVDVGANTLLNLDQFTVSAWVRYTGIQNDATFDRWEVLEKPDAYWMNVRTDGHVRVGGFFGGCTSASWKYFDSTRTLPVGAWHHLGFTHDATKLRVYIDGKAAGSMAVTGHTCVSDQPLAVGAKNNPAKGLLEAFWDGKLDEVRVYNRALSATEIGQLALRS